MVQINSGFTEFLSEQIPWCIKKSIIHPSDIASNIADILLKYMGIKGSFSLNVSVKAASMLMLHINLGLYLILEQTT